MQGILFASILPAQPERRPRLWIVLLSSCVFASLFVFLNAGRWLVVDDTLQKASAIAVLSGRMPSRALEAARVYRQGYAPRVWLTHAREPAKTMEKLAIPYVGEEMYDKQILMKEGIPESAIRVLEPPIVNTADEIETIGDALRKENPRTVVLVTSKVHTRRVRALWNRLGAQDGTAIIRGDSEDSFDPSHWWKDTGDALDVVREILGLLNVWAGLPLRPAA